jgi:hypothetical protein
MMTDKEFAELQLRAAICPHQVRWPKEHMPWQRIHDVANEARARVSRACAALDEIDRNANLSRDDKKEQRQKIASLAIADFDVSRTLARAREAVKLHPEIEALTAMKEAEHGWQRAIDMILERAAQTKAPRVLAAGAVVL